MISIKRQNYDTTYCTRRPTVRRSATRAVGIV